MDLKSWSLALAAVALGLLATGSPSSAGNSGIGTALCNNVNISYAPTTLWPPNHKMQTITITATDPDTSFDTDNFTITVNSIASNQTEGRGDGCGKPTSKQGADWSGVGNTAGALNGGTAVTSAEVRAERCADIKGARVYDINIACTETNDPGQTFHTDLFITVPHHHGH